MDNQVKKSSTSNKKDENFKNITEIGTSINIQQDKAKLTNQINSKAISNNNFILFNEAEYKLNSNRNVSSIKEYFPYPLLIGLDNIGATSYMNSTLQCFCNIEKFVNYFKYNKLLIDLVNNDIYKLKLSSAFKLLIDELWPDNYEQNKVTHFSPYNFKDIISKMNPMFKEISANDAKDLVSFIIMTLHDELNKARNYNMNINNFHSLDHRNQEVMLHNFIRDFAENNQSIISDLFYAAQCFKTQCSNCKTLSYIYQSYFLMEFPLEEVRKYKVNNINQFNNFNNISNNDEINIYDCFEYNQKIDYMTGENGIYCSYCKKKCDTSMRTVLTTGPEILYIILNRGRGIEFKVNFMEYLNLSNYIQFNNTGVNYELIGVIIHLGEKGLLGHFIAFCKNPISKEWIKYNDDKVTSVNDLKSEVIDCEWPYLLFYQKIN